MPYGICPLSLIPVRSHADDTSEMHTQLLYGDHFTILESRKHWSRIRIAMDGTEGWIYNRQFEPLTKKDFELLQSGNQKRLASDLVSFACTEKGTLIPVLLGSSVSSTRILGHRFEGTSTNGTIDKGKLIETALLYLNAPYLWGGKTPFGIDCSGLAQMVYRINGLNLLRNAAEQSTLGEALSFIEESEEGDLAFFDNKEGLINHVGIIMKDNYIIHAHGKVRIDRLDHTGIFNSGLGRYSHKLRVIKKVL